MQAYAGKSFIFVLLAQKNYAFAARGEGVV